MGAGPVLLSSNSVPGSSHGGRRSVVRAPQDSNLCYPAGVFSGCVCEWKTLNKVCRFFYRWIRFSKRTLFFLFVCLIRLSFAEPVWSNEASYFRTRQFRERLKVNFCYISGANVLYPLEI